MATKNYCRHVMGRKLGWWLVYKILSGKAVAWLGVFMLLLSPAISLEHGLIHGCARCYNNYRNISGNDCYTVCLPKPPWRGCGSRSMCCSPLAATPKDLLIGTNSFLSFIRGISLWSGWKSCKHPWWPCSPPSAVFAVLCESLHLDCKREQCL